MSGVWWRTPWLSLLLGCTPLGLWLYDDPVVTVDRITLQFERSGPAKSPVVVALAVHNVNDYPLSTERLELALRLDGIPIGHLQRDSAVPVATDTVSTVALPLLLEKKATPAHLRALGSGTHKFAVFGRATFRTPIGTRRVPFAQEGSLVFGVRPTRALPSP